MQILRKVVNLEEAKENNEDHYRKSIKNIIIKFPQNTYISNLRNNFFLILIMKSY